MAKVIAPLHSFDASGRIGGIVFITGGVVRTHFIPANPRTVSQQNQRQNMSVSGSVVRTLGNTTRDLIKVDEDVIGSKPQKYWPALFGQAVNRQVTAANTAFTALTVAQKAAWETEAVAAGLPNATDPVVTAGVQLFLGAFTLFSAGIHLATGTPDGTNHAAWKTALTG